MCCIMLSGAIIAALLAAYTSLSEYWKSPVIAIFGSSTLPVIFYYALKAYLWIRKIPPGPWGFPGIGSLWEMNWGNTLLKCQEYSKKFGKVFQMRVGFFRVTVLSDYKQIQDAMRKGEFQGRPDFELWTLRNRGVKNRGILVSDAVKSWEEQRQLASTTLQSGGIGKESFESVLAGEAKELVNSLKRSQGTPVSVGTLLNRSVFNSLWKILCGDRLEVTDARFSEVMSLIGGRWDKALLFNVAYFFPWLAKLNLFGMGAWDVAKKMVENVTDALDEIIKDHLNTFREGQSRDYIDAYLHQHFQAERSSSFAGREGIQHLRVTLLDLFQAGTETTAATLSWAILFVARSPHMQRKLQEEIHVAIGSDRPPSRHDRAKMPYLEAFTTEVHRKASVAPFSVLHQVTEDCRYRFEKGTIIIFNIYAAHHDTKYWEDPEKFRPERFLDPSGKNLLPKQALMPFSSGRRVCPGEFLARDTIFLFLATLLQNFNFELDPSSPEVDVHSPIPYFVSSPSDFKVILTSRNPRY